jgi:hypothetical protein
VAGHSSTSENTPAGLKNMQEAFVLLDEPGTPGAALLQIAKYGGYFLEGDALPLKATPGIPPRPSKRKGTGPQSWPNRQSSCSAGAGFSLGPGHIQHLLHDARFGNSEKPSRRQDQGPMPAPVKARETPLPCNGKSTITRQVIPRPKRIMYADGRHLRVEGISISPSWKCPKVLQDQ